MKFIFSRIYKNTNNMSITHADEMNEIKLRNRKNRGVKHLVAQQIIDKTNDVEEGKKYIDKVDKKEELEQLSGSGIERKIGAGRRKKQVEPITAITEEKPKRKQTAWQKLVQETMKEKGMNLKDTLKYIKDNNLYKK